MQMSENNVTDAPARSRAVSPDQICELTETIMTTARVLKASKPLHGTTVGSLDVSLVPLLFVLGSGPARVGEVAEQLHGDMSTISRQVSHLVDEGYATKLVHEADRRVVQVSLTDSGRRALDQIRAARMAWISAMVADWTSSDIELFQNFLTRLIDAARGADPEPLHARHSGHRPDRRVPASDDDDEEIAS